MFQHLNTHYFKTQMVCSHSCMCLNLWKVSAFYIHIAYTHLLEWLVVSGKICLKFPRWTILWEFCQISKFGRETHFLKVFVDKCDVGKQRGSEIPRVGIERFMIWPGWAVPYLSTWVRSLPISHSSPSLISRSREHQEHKVHGPCSLSPESFEWLGDTEGDLALLTYSSPCFSHWRTWF